MLFSLGATLPACFLLAEAYPATQNDRVQSKVGLKKGSGAARVPGAPADAARLKSHLTYTEDKIIRGIDTYARNTGTPNPLAPRNSRRADHQPDTTWSVPLTGSGEDPWYGTISVGQPERHYTVQFDTGSSDLWLPGTDCRFNCDLHHLYDPDYSTTAYDGSGVFRLEYSDGTTTEGTLRLDEVMIGGFKSSEQDLGSAQSYAAGFGADFPADGVMGLAFKSLSEFHAPSFFDNIVHHDMADPVFAFKLTDQGASLTIGKTDKMQYSGTIAYAPITAKGFWQVYMDGMGVGGRQVVGRAQAVIDTGSSFIIGDPTSVASFYSAISGARDVGSGFYTIPCRAIPAVALSFAGQVFSISPETFSLGPASQGSSECVGGVVASSRLGNFWVVGDVFLRNVYSVFDMGDKRVGFANLA